MAAPTNQQLLAAAQIASTNMNFQIPPISIKLDRDNYSLWRTTIVSALECFDLDSFVLNPVPPPATITPAVAALQAANAPPVVPIPNPDFITWKKKDRFVLLWIKSTLSDRCLATVVRSTSSQQAWQTLERTFQAQTRAHRMAMKNKLHTLTKGSLSMIDYIEQKRQIADSLAENLTPINDEDLIGYILNGLDASYSSFASAFIMHSNTTTVDDLVGLLLQEEARLDQDLARQALTQLPSPTTVANSSFPTANQVSRNPHNRPFSQNTNSNYRGNDHSQNRGFDNSRGSDNRRRRPHCQLCNKPGHEAINCWQRGNQTDYPSRRPPPRDQTRDQPRQAHIANYQSPSNIDMDQPWYFDTGATDHVTPDLNKLNLNEQYTGDDKLQVGNGHTHPSRPR